MFLSKKSKKKLRIAYTLGDLGGVGPEIFEKFRLANASHPLFEIVLVDEFLNYQELFKKIRIGEPSKAAGEHAYQALAKANELALNGDIDCLVTGPVAKESLSLAAYKFSGQTEVLASLNNLSTEDIEMFFVLDDFRVALATRHIPLKDISENLIKRFPTVVENSFVALKEIFQIEDPKIAVAGINPHAGENGLLGSEEIEHLLPLINKFKNSGSRIEGPLPADTLFAKLAHSYLSNKIPPYDLYIAAYHDQALSLIKGLGGYRAINLTTGLPYIRASVDHGTAYDIAGKDIADPDGLKACTEFVLKILAKNPEQMKKVLNTRLAS